MKVPNGITNYRRTIIYRFAITSVQLWASSLNISIVCIRFRDYGNGTFCMSHPFLNSHWSILLYIWFVIVYRTFCSYFVHLIFIFEFYNTLLVCAWLFDRKENARRPCRCCLKLRTTVCQRRDHELTTWTGRLSLSHKTRVLENQILGEKWRESHMIGQTNYENWHTICWCYCIFAMK
jgi:hypothetical protein